MTAQQITQIVLFLAAVLILVKPLGWYMARVYEGKPCGLDRVLGPVERLTYRLAGVRAAEEMTWQRYATALLAFSFVGFVSAYALMRVQAWLPLNPEHLAAVPPDLSFNTAVSFLTNTNWQAYGGETTMSYLTQMLALAVHNFLSAATGMAVLVALTRGFARRNSPTIGNFWVDLTRTTLYILLPLSLILAIALVSQGVVQTLKPYPRVALVEPVKDADGKLVTEQTIAVGPTASQVAIKHLGTNGGGFFNANSAHPLENATPLSNFLEMLAILLIPCALCYTFGSMVGDPRQGWTLLAAMASIFVCLLALCCWAEQKGTPQLATAGADQQPSLTQCGGNMEGKEVRFGIANSALFATMTTGTSCGAVNSMHDSFTPLGGLVPMWLIELGEVVFGGVGSGLYGMLVFAIVAVFIAGLMVGRTPEYLGKKIEAFEMKMASMVVLVPVLLALIGTAIAVMTQAGRAGVANPGPHGFSEILYAYSSASNNNGSAFAGLSANSVFYNISTALAMLCGRFLFKLPVLAIAGALAAKKSIPVSAGTLKTHGALFVVLLVSVVLIVGALSFIPALALGPIVEHLIMVGAGDEQMSDKTRETNLLDWAMIGPAIRDSFYKLDPRVQARNPVMFVVLVGSALTTVLFIHALFGKGEASPWFILAVSLWLWFTVLFANFAEAVAEGRGKAQAESLRKARKDVIGKKLAEPRYGAAVEPVAASRLVKGDVVLVEAAISVPADGDVIEGAASVDESAVTGESAPVIRESGGDRSAVTGGTRVLSDWIVVRVTASAGESFLDRMIAMVEGAKRQKTPNEIALNILLAALTIVFVVVCATLLPYSLFSVQQAGKGSAVTITVLVALLVCLAPTTIGALLSAIGIAGMSRLSQANVVAMSGRAVEAAGDVDVLLLDKTGTITLGNRQATAFIPAEGVSAEELADAAQLSSLADETPEGRSIVVLAKRLYNLRGREIEKLGAKFITFSAHTRMSGVDFGDRQIRKGAPDAIGAFVTAKGSFVTAQVHAAVQSIAREGGTPLIVADGGRVLGTIHLKDIVKGGIKERFGDLRRMGIKTVMITGDNPVTAAAIAAEAGVDNFLAEATPENKLKLIREYQSLGHLVAMTGDGTNDAPALAQADVAVAMNTGTQAAKEAGNMVDLDSSPTKLLEVVQIGKQTLMTRGALTTFSIANDVAKYFAIIPAAFASTYPALGTLNVMGLATPNSAILSAVIFNAIIIVFLIPLALRGVKYRPIPATQLLKRNLLVYGVGGRIVPFIGIKLIDLALAAMHLV